ncbi:CTL-like protein DDB_G0274487 [Anopheles moucheti]|uniref:CTL-like protein DDB_G0274487 n=1 Tax=Anopheles moucheti TaxID=186751 RepID=UPI0022F01116|nr:CTL-like protein DDB_G0274487 [Anopheles moucheti]
MTNSTFSKGISGVICLVLTVVHMAEAIPVLKSGPGIEIMPAAYSPDGNLNFVVVDENKDVNTNSQSVTPTVYEPAVQTQYVQPQEQQPPQIQYPVTQQPQIQYQPAAPQQVQYQPYYQTAYQQQPQYAQPAQYPAPPPGYSPQSGPYYSSAGPIGERGGFLSGFSGPNSSRYSPLGALGSIGSSLPTRLSEGASLLGAALLIG